MLENPLGVDLTARDRQLRFRLGTSWAFTDGAAGWARSHGSAYELEPNGELLELATAREVSSLGPEPGSKLEHQVDVAIRWLERARFESEPITSLLFLFFALEAVLGQKSEGLKGHMLAFRQALLGLAMGEGFTHPDDTFRPYNADRSMAVHGESLPLVDEDTVRKFAGTV